jgi:hypothetical protein
MERLRHHHGWIPLAGSARASMTAQAPSPRAGSALVISGGSHSGIGIDSGDLGQGLEGSSRKLAHLTVVCARQQIEELPRHRGSPLGRSTQTGQSCRGILRGRAINIPRGLRCPSRVLATLGRTRP